MEQKNIQKQNSKIIKIAKIVGELICAIILGHIIYISSITTSTYASNAVAHYISPNLELGQSFMSIVLTSVLFLILLQLFLTKIIKKKKDRIFFILVVMFAVFFDIYMPFGNIVYTYNYEYRVLFEERCIKETSYGGMRVKEYYVCEDTRDDRIEAYCESIGLDFSFSGGPWHKISYCGKDLSFLPPPCKEYRGDICVDR